MALPGAQIVISAIDRTKAAFASVKGALTGLGERASLLRSNLAGIFTGLTVLGFVAQVRSAVDAMDAAGKSAQKVGTSVQNFSALTFAASQSDVSVETLEKSLARLARQLDEAKSGTGEAADAFKRLDIDPRQFKDPADALIVLADRFSKMPDGVNKSALAMQIFGKAGADLIPLLNQGREGIAALTAEAKRLGVVFTDEAAAAAEQLNDNLDKLKTASKGLNASIAQEVVGPLTQVTNAMIEAAKDAGLLQAAWVGLGGLGTALFTNDLETLEQRLRRLKDEFEDATTGLFTNQSRADEITKQIKETERLIEAEREAFKKRREESQKTQEALGENREAETREFKSAVDEQIKDADRLNQALQAAFSQSLKNEQDYLREARKLRAEASQGEIDPNDIEAQASAKLDAILAVQKLARISPTAGLDDVREQADLVRDLAGRFEDAALKENLLKQANLAEAAALEKAAAAERERAQGLAAQQTANEERLAAARTALDAIGKGATVDINLGESANATMVFLDNMIAKINFINEAGLNPNGTLKSSTSSGLPNLTDATLKRGVRP